jgi:hypothetical protein
MYHVGEMLGTNRRAIPERLHPRPKASVHGKELLSQQPSVACKNQLEAGRW